MYASMCAMEKKVILITGASSGIGYDSALKLAEQGHKVYGAARRIEKMEPLREKGVTPIGMDVSIIEPSGIRTPCSPPAGGML